jgi:ankyrin repeat protein
METNNTKQNAAATSPNLLGILALCRFFGLHPIVEYLIIGHSQDVCSRDSTGNATPLHLASRNGHAKAACKLIEHGADLTAQKNDGWTPLHLASKWGQVDVARMLSTGRI